MSAPGQRCKAFVKLSCELRVKRYDLSVSVRLDVAIRRSRFFYDPLSAPRHEAASLLWVPAAVEGMKQRLRSAAVRNRDVQRSRDEGGIRHDPNLEAWKAVSQGGYVSALQPAHAGFVAGADVQQNPVRR